MKEGERRTTKEICKSRDCEICGEKATARLTFLLPSCRSNPASSAYGKDDCSWCSDAEMFVCKEHEKDRYKIAKELNMEWCGLFPNTEKFKHMFLYWHKE